MALPIASLALRSSLGSLSSVLRLSVSRQLISQQALYNIQKEVNIRTNLALKSVLEEAFRTFAGIEVYIDKADVDKTMKEYQKWSGRTMVNIVVKRVSNVCMKLTKRGFLNNLPAFRSAAEASALEKARFYSQRSIVSRNTHMRFGAWLLMQARGYKSKDGVLIGKSALMARELLPKTSAGIPKLKYGTLRNRGKAVKTATTRFIDKVKKPQPARFAGFLSKAIANGANKMMNYPHRNLRADTSDRFLSKASRTWAKRAGRNAPSRTKRGKFRGGIKLGTGKLSGTTKAPYAEVYVAGDLWRRAVQSYVPLLAKEDVSDMKQYIKRKVEEENSRQAKKSASIARASLIELKTGKSLRRAA